MPKRFPLTEGQVYEAVLHVSAIGGSNEVTINVSYSSPLPLDEADEDDIIEIPGSYMLMQKLLETVAEIPQEEASKPQSALKLVTKDGQLLN